MHEHDPRAGFEVQLYALLRALYTGEESREDVTHYLSRLIAEAAEQGYQRGYAVGLSGARKTARPESRRYNKRIVP